MPEQDMIESKDIEFILGSGSQSKICGTVAADAPPEQPNNPDDDARVIEQASPAAS